MRNIKKASLLSILFLVTTVTGKFEFVKDDYSLTLGGYFKPEMFYGKNISLLNSNNRSDKTWFARHTLDLDADLLYGMTTYCKPVAEFYFTIRNRSIWGNLRSISSTTEATVFDTGVVLGAHSHSIPRHIFWIREIWSEFDVSELFYLSFMNTHKLKLGAFSFQLGRGITLGDAYAVGPENLGFYTESVVDQYAFGAKLSGDLVPGYFSYDLYTAILNNRSATLSETAERIRTREFGRRLDPVRGFGIINFVIAAKLNWDVFDNDRFGKLHIEPYGMYNHDPEQTIESLGDATSKLGSLGIASEYTGDIFEFGFDFAFNLGKQTVKAYDRNVIEKNNVDGNSVFVNSRVVDQNNNKVPFVPNSEAQKLIFENFDSADSENKNGEIIATIDGNVGYLTGPVVMRNGNLRYRKSFINKYHGRMFVTDGGVWLYKKDLFFALSAGFASGDENPNEEQIDGVYDGFISLQELYSGKRVRSAFLLGGAGKAKRPLTVPNRDRSPNRFAQTISGFTNIVYCGTSLKWEPTDWCSKFKVQPNILAYWQDKPTPKFDANLGRQIDELASTFLGVETNLFFDYYVFENSRFYFVGSIFFPGSHYRDIRGLPLTREQEEALNRLNRSGFDGSRVPNLGDDAAYTFNIGIEFSF